MRFLAVFLACLLAGCGGGTSKRSGESIATAEAQRKFALADLNADGSVTAAEVEAISAKEFADMQKAGIPLEVPGTNGMPPGAAEFLAAHKLRIASADGNADGRITLAEYTAWYLNEAKKK